MRALTLPAASKRFGVSVCATVVSRNTDVHVCTPVPVRYVVHGVYCYESTHDPFKHAFADMRHAETRVNQLVSLHLSPASVISQTTLAPCVVESVHDV